MTAAATTKSSTGAWASSILGFSFVFSSILSTFVKTAEFLMNLVKFRLNSQNFA
jgi:hypothetical protein